MKTLLTLIVFAAAGLLMVLGAYRAAACRFRQKRCTVPGEGRVAELWEKRSALYWPAMARYYLIVEYAAAGEMRLGTSPYPAQHPGQLEPGQRLSLRYDPARPERFFVESWDEGGFQMGLAQCGLGALLLLITFLTR